MLGECKAHLAGLRVSVRVSAPVVRQRGNDNGGDPEFEKVTGPLHLDE